jgi:hypothetical protein
MLLCFLVKVDSGLFVCVTTILLSTKVLQGPSYGTTNYQGFIMRASTFSVDILSAKNPEPKVLDSTVLCRLLYQTIGAPH